MINILYTLYLYESAANSLSCLCLFYYLYVFCIQSIFINIDETFLYLTDITFLCYVSLLLYFQEKKYNDSITCTPLCRLYASSI